MVNLDPKPIEEECITELREYLLVKVIFHKDVVHEPTTFLSPCKRLFSVERICKSNAARYKALT